MSNEGPNAGYVEPPPAYLDRSGSSGPLPGLDDDLADVAPQSSGQGSVGTLPAPVSCSECSGVLDAGMQAVSTPQGIRCVKGSRACRKTLREELSPAGDLSEAKATIARLRRELEMREGRISNLTGNLNHALLTLNESRQALKESRRELNMLKAGLREEGRREAMEQRTIAWAAERGDELSAQCSETQRKAQKEYAHGAAFGNFERAAELFGLSRETVLAIFMWKHFDGIAAWIKGHRSQRENVKGRILDASVYLRLLYAMVIDLEERGELDVSPEPAQGEAGSAFSVLKELLERAPDDPGSAMFLNRVLEHLDRELKGAGK